jgi:hypothetical protein
MYVNIPVSPVHLLRNAETESFRVTEARSVTIEILCPETAVMLFVK